MLAILTTYGNVFCERSMPVIISTYSRDQATAGKLKKHFLNPMLAILTTYGDEASHVRPQDHRSKEGRKTREELLYYILSYSKEVNH